MKVRFGWTAAVAKSRCVFLARLAQDGFSALARLSFHIAIEYGILAGEPLLARPQVAEGACAMAGFTTDWQQKVLDHSTGKAPIGAPPTVHVALFIVPPTDASGGTECNDTGYGRAATSAAT